MSGCWRTFRTDPFSARLESQTPRGWRWWILGSLDYLMKTSPLLSENQINNQWYSIAEGKSEEESQYKYTWEGKSFCHSISYYLKYFKERRKTIASTPSLRSSQVLLALLLCRILERNARNCQETPRPPPSFILRTGHRCWIITSLYLLITSTSPQLAWTSLCIKWERKYKLSSV